MVIFSTTSGFPFPIGVNAENTSMSWRHHAHRPYQAMWIWEGTNSMKTIMLSSSYWSPVEFQNGTPILTDTGAIINLLSTRGCGFDFKCIFFQCFHILPLGERCWTPPRTNVDPDLCRHMASLGHNESAALVPPDLAGFGQLFWLSFLVTRILFQIIFVASVVPGDGLSSLGAKTSPDTVMS